MGDIADMMLEGFLDSETGEYIGDINEGIYGDQAPGFPITYNNMDNPEAKAWEESHRGNWDKRAKNREWSTNRLIELGVNFESKNDGAHLIVRHGENVVDFWPGTGKYIFRKSSTKGRGINRLLKAIGINQGQ
jgi:hypothetical protein